MSDFTIHHKILCELVWKNETKSKSNIDNIMKIIANTSNDDQRELKCLEAYINKDFIRKYNR